MNQKDEIIVVITTL